MSTTTGRDRQLTSPDASHDERHRQARRVLIESQPPTRGNRCDDKAETMTGFARTPEKTGST